jgi:hypothetical protein
VKYVQSGDGISSITFFKNPDLDSLKAIFPTDAVVFAVLARSVKETTNVVTKVLLVTMVGPKTGEYFFLNVTIFSSNEKGTK